MPLVSAPALLHAHLQQEPRLRPSNRLPRQPRAFELNVSSLTHCNGSAVVKIGGTSVVCGVRGEILPVSEIPSYGSSSSSSSSTSFPSTTTAPRPSKLSDEQEISLYNLLVPNLELATGCSPLHPANTAPSTEAQSISQRLLSLLHTSHLVPLSDLQVWHHPSPDTDPTATQADPHELPPGLDPDTSPHLKAFWVLYIDCICISHTGSGSVFDASWLAIYAALRDTLLPNASWDVDTKAVICSPEIRDARRLGLRGMPVPLSFGVFVPDQVCAPGKTDAERRKMAHVLVDMDGFEEECCAEGGCVVVDVDDGDVEVVRLEKAGGGVAGVGEIQEMLGVAEQRWRECKVVFDTQLKSAM